MNNNDNHYWQYTNRVLMANKIVQLCKGIYKHCIWINTNCLHGNAYNLKLIDIKRHNWN